MTNPPCTGNYEREEFPISGIGDKQCEYHCQNKYSCERADWIETDAWITIGNCFIYISEPTNTSLECSNCKMNGQFITKCKTRMLWNFLSTHEIKSNSFTFKQSSEPKVSTNIKYQCNLFNAPKTA